MRLSYSPAHEALRQELRQYYAKLLTPDLRAEIRRSEGVGPIVREIVLQMGRDGWLGIGWPKEYGGLGMTPIEQFIFFDESMRAGAPVPMLTVNSVAPTIMQYGSDEQKRFYLPKILRGEIHFAMATRSRTPAPTWRRSRRAPSSTATSGSSTGRRSSRASPPTPTTSGSPCAPIRTPKSTAASR